MDKEKIELIDLFAAAALTGYLAQGYSRKVAIEQALATAEDMVLERKNQND